jgi:hypothetical protein
MAMQQVTSPRDTAKWQHWGLLALAALLFVSPWLFQFGGGGQGFTALSSSMSDPGVTGGVGGERIYFDPGMVAPILGIILAVLALLSVYRIPVAQEWLVPVLGLWIIVSPYILGFSGAHGAIAAWVFLVIGIGTVALSLSTLPLIVGAMEPRPNLAHAGDKPSVRPPEETPKS